MQANKQTKMHESKNASPHRYISNLCIVCHRIVVNIMGPPSIFFETVLMRVTKEGVINVNGFFVITITPLCNGHII